MRLRMNTGRTQLGSTITCVQVSAVTAAPGHLLSTLEHTTIFDIGEQIAKTLFMLFSATAIAFQAAAISENLPLLQRWKTRGKGPDVPHSHPWPLRAGFLQLCPSFPPEMWR